ncbi:MAG: hypothetical protein IPH81_04160 [Candidatus Microthrix sp.]|nr:hypothetical protein [Candidatus Microthrix sp.]
MNDPNRILSPSSRPSVVLTRKAVSQLYPEMAKSLTTRKANAHAAAGAAPPSRTARTICVEAGGAFCSLPRSIVIAER